MCDYYKIKLFVILKLYRLINNNELNNKKMSDNLTATKQYIYAIKSKKYVIYLIEKTRINNYLSDGYKEEIKNYDAFN